MTSLDASSLNDLRPLASVLAELQQAAAACDTKIMVVGATARDILIRRIVGSAPERATADLDIAVAVADWSDVDRMTDTMEQVGGCVHRFVVQGIEVDIIPFGDIESRDRTITWSNDHMMGVFGFREALATATDVRLPVTLSSLSLPCPASRS